MGISHASHPKGAEPQRSPIFGLPLFIFAPLDVEQPNRRGNMIRRLALEGQRSPPSQRVVAPTDPHFAGCYLSLMRTSDILVLKLISILVFILFSSQNFYFI